MRGSRHLARTWAAAASMALVGCIVLGVTASAASAIDIRGDWSEVTTARGVQYPQVLHIATEDLSSGAFSGTDVGGATGNGQVFALSGTLNGRNLTSTATGGGYTANSVGTISASGAALTMSGTFTDSNQNSGTFTATLTTPAAVAPPTVPPTGVPAAATSAPARSSAPAVPAPSSSSSAGTATRLGASSLAASITPPSTAFSSVGLAVANAVIALAAMLFITFPAHLFNHTFQENYEEIRSGVKRRLPWIAVLRQRLKRSAPDGNRQLVIFAFVVLAGGFLGGLLSPNFGVNLTSVASYLATVFSVVLGVTLSFLVAWGYRRARHHEHAARLQALPLGLAVAAVCVLISRVTDFRPGYLYGVVAGVAFATSLEKKENGHVVALSTMTTLALAVLAWLAWVPVNAAAATSGAGFPVVSADDVLGALFVGGLVGSVIGLVPLNFLPGGALATWHRGVWGAMFAIALFGVVELMLHPQKGDGHPGGAPLITVIGLLVLFGGSSVAFAGYFARRRRREAIAKQTV